MDATRLYAAVILPALSPASPPMSLRKAVLQRITPLPSRTPSPNIPHDWPQSPVEFESDKQTTTAHPVHIAPDEHLASRSKTPYAFLCL